MTASADARKTVAFYFDFTSPYGYFAAVQIEALAARTGVQVDWNPILLGPIFKLTGMAALSTMPLRGPYGQRDWQRIARLLAVPCRMPDGHPLATVAPARLFYWLKDGDPAAAVAYAKAVFAAEFGEGRNVGAKDEALRIAAALGHDADACAAALDDPAVKQRLFDANDAAVAAGVFGSPFFIVDDEPFWGWDRMGMLETWITRGGF